MKACTVCGSHNLNAYTHRGSTERHAWWCEDCGSMHTEMGVSCPEKSMLHHQVLAFHRRFGQSVGEKPHVPSDEDVRFRLNLIAEEFFELLEAAGYYIGAVERGKVDASDICKSRIQRDVDLPAFVDALADLDYVVEGTRIVFGVNGHPIAAEVQRANMSKVPAKTGDRYGGHGAEIVRPKKPEGWEGPDIGGELKMQGWGCRYCSDPACTEGCRT